MPDTFRLLPSANPPAKVRILYLSPFFFRTAANLDLMIAFIKRLFSKRKKNTFVDLSGKAQSDEEYNRIRQAQQEEAMRILGKISSQGKDSLSPDEKEFLEKFSRSNYAR